MSNYQHAKEMYLAGKNITDIATFLNLSRTAIYSYKNKDKKAGADWDELRFIKATDAKDAESNEQDFVALLIFEFEKALEKLNDSEPSAQIETIAKYINTYYKLKQQRENPKINRADMAKQILHEVSQIALDKEAKAVIRFLSEHADQIVVAAIK